MTDASEKKAAYFDDLTVCLLGDELRLLPAGILLIIVDYVMDEKQALGGHFESGYWWSFTDKRGILFESADLTSETFEWFWSLYVKETRLHVLYWVLEEACKGKSPDAVQCVSRKIAAFGRGERADLIDSFGKVSAHGHLEAAKILDTAYSYTSAEILRSHILDAICAADQFEVADWFVSRFSLEAADFRSHPPGFSKRPARIEDWITRIFTRRAHV